MISKLKVQTYNHYNWKVFQSTNVDRRKQRRNKRKHHSNTQTVSLYLLEVENRENPPYNYIQHFQWFVVLNLKMSSIAKPFTWWKSLFFFFLFLFAWDSVAGSIKQKKKKATITKSPAHCYIKVSLLHSIDNLNVKKKN